MSPTLSELHFLLAAARAELIRTWSKGPRVQYREWKRRRRIMDRINCELAAEADKFKAAAHA